LFQNLTVYNMKALHLPGLSESSAPPFSLSESPSPAALQYSTSIPDPVSPTSPETHTYLIAVTATALTRGELTWPEILDVSRFSTDRGAIPGHDIVGTIHTVHTGPKASQPPTYRPGDKVWGLIDFHRDGAAASLAIAQEYEIASLPSAPASIDQKSWEIQLASLPLSGLTAYQALFDHGDLDPSLLTSTPKTVKPLPRILILGPTGSVGLPLLYLALASSLPVILYTNPSHIRFVKSLANSSPTANVTIISSADTSLPNLPNHFSSNKIQPVDIMIDCLGGPLAPLLLSPSIKHLFAPTRTAGVPRKLISVAAPLHPFQTDYGTLPSLFAAAQMEEATQNLSSCGIEYDFFIVKPQIDQLAVLGQLATQGKIVGHVAATFSLEKGVQAMECVEGVGGKKANGRGKIVLTVD
jgi:NADPH:quinone reductase-like Zn-dependent oxidoreductase